jgi:hypothetical protein
MLLHACNKNQTDENSELNDYSKGVIIINEGNFMHANGDLSYYDPETESISNNIFSAENEGNPAGDVIQSFAATDSLGLFTSNSSKTLTAVDLKTFKYRWRIENLEYPRFIAADNDSIAYMTDGKLPGRLLKINLTKMTIANSAEIGTQPENLLITENYILCCNGAWGADSTVSIFNKTDFSLEQNLTVGKGATDITRDKYGNIWVLCQGETLYDDNWEIVSETPSELVCLNSETFEAITRLEIGETGDGFQPIRLAGSSTADFIAVAEKAGIIKISVENYTSEQIIKGNFYGLEIQPATNHIFVFSDENFQSNGYMEIYDAFGNRIKEKTETGVGPNGAYFLASGRK